MCVVYKNHLIMLLKMKISKPIWRFWWEIKGPAFSFPLFFPSPPSLLPFLPSSFHFFLSSYVVPGWTQGFSHLDKASDIPSSSLHLYQPLQRILGRLLDVLKHKKHTVLSPLPLRVKLTLNFWASLFLRSLVFFFLFFIPKSANYSSILFQAGALIVLG